MITENCCLTVENLRAGYERDIPVIENISMRVATGSVTGLIGANGAGKSSLLKTILGYLKPETGSVIFEGKDISGLRPDTSASLGISYLMEGHCIFPGLSVEENLLLGMWPWRSDRARVRSALERAFERAPLLKTRRRESAGLLSGGQQRILELERVYMTNPSLIFLDEPSLGLAPNLAAEMFDRIESFRHEGITVVLIDQNIRRVMEIADYVYVLQLGKFMLEGKGAVLNQDVENIVKKFI
jgi:branched-chain amino acid transport system ATP-binding protein